jgi:hypothetical protein
LPDYYDVIKRPIALTEMHAKLQAGAYRSLCDFQQDLQQMFSNARTYNAPDSEVCHDVATLEQLVKRAIQDHYSSLAAETRPKWSKEDTIQLTSVIEIGDIGALKSTAQHPEFNVNLIVEGALGSENCKWTLLQYAAYLGQDLVVRTLIQLGADLDLRDKLYGGTALAWAAFANKIDAAKLLADAGANQFISNRRGQLPMELIPNPSMKWAQIFPDLAPFDKLSARDMVERLAQLKDKRCVYRIEYHVDFYLYVVANSDVIRSWTCPKRLNIQIITRRFLCQCRLK